MTPATDPSVPFSPADDDDLVLEDWMEGEDDLELELIELDET